MKILKSMATFDKELETAIAIAREAGEIMLKYFDEDQQIEHKADKSHVTIADKLINTLAIKRLAEAFPEDGVIGEEESTSGFGGGRKWFCDPIDGTAAYVWGTPTAMFSLALIVDGKPAIGVAFDPFLNRMYTGKAGEQSYCNGKVMTVSSKDLSNGILGISGSIKTLPSTVYFPKLINDKVRIATFSGAVYKGCLIAKGRLVGYIEHGLSPHDVAAIHLIVEGAGGKITSIDGAELDYSSNFKGAIISNGVVHEKLVEYCRE